MAKTATKLSPPPLQKHSPGDSTIDMPTSNCHQQGALLAVCGQYTAYLWLGKSAVCMPACIS